MDKFPTEEDYMSIAAVAAAAERCGDWLYAARLWSQAEVMARSSLNRDWSGTRMQFCMRQWRYGGAVEQT
ncbi:ANR family transcriptional regulator [Salmonella enterica subsp. enterica serovar Newport]|nr:ANR family transcriptional regulator [Salmonella enterica subsp. enterica serovar Newport]MJR82331.1 hypothetical protein [Salmonella enterica subsp. enterica serovar Newport]HAE2415110.1 ANR family transcriptional regulator [Salmonella enterica subsp. enterica serovar Newport]